MSNLYYQSGTAGQLARYDPGSAKGFTPAAGVLEAVADARPLEG